MWNSYWHQNKTEAFLTPCSCFPAVFQKGGETPAVWAEMTHFFPSKIWENCRNRENINERFEDEDKKVSVGGRTHSEQCGEVPEDF